MPGKTSIRAAKVALPACYALALAIPGFVFFDDRGGTAFLSGADGRIVLQLLFPLFGLYAFTFLTVQILITTNLAWLSRIWPRVIRYHRGQGVVGLLFAITHPLVILVGYGIATFLASAFTRPGVTGWLIPGYLALGVLLLTVTTALLGWSGRRLSRWRGLHRLTYLAFGLAWLHSWFIGTDTQTGRLRAVWVGYLVLVIASTIGRYRSQLLSRPGGRRSAAPAAARGSAPKELATSLPAVRRPRAQ